MLHAAELIQVKVLRLVVFLFAAAIVAAALTASRPTAPIPKLWLQNPPSVVTKLPGSFWVDEMLF